MKIYGDYRDARQFQGSKKKARRKQMELKQKEKERHWMHKVRLDEAIENGDMETAAKLMGVRLR